MSVSFDIEGITLALVANALAYFVHNDFDACIIREEFFRGCYGI